MKQLTTHLVIFPASSPVIASPVRPGPALLLLGIFAIGCSAPAPAPVMQGRASMLSESAIAQKCEEAAKGHLKPFVIEWDATDLASFEAKAAMSTIFVRYDGCSMEPIYTCTDRANPTVFGSYGSPHFTSGTVQQLDVSNEGQLYAKLPLGAAKLSGRVQAGESLHLKYYVSGVAMSSREEVFAGELAGYGGCADATHFVWAYNLGAFELGSEENSSSQAEASVVGIGQAEGSGSHKQSSVANGGEIASCKTQGQRACRVPIRVVLRPIAEGAHPADAAAAGGAPGGAPPGGYPTPSHAELAARGAQMRADAEEYQTIQRNSQAAADAANKAFQDDDGVACLRYIDRAIELDARRIDGLETIRIMCLMMADRCDDGKKMLRTKLANDDAKRLRSDEDLDKEVRDWGNRHCPAHDDDPDADYLYRASRSVHKLRKAGKNAKECRRVFNESLKRMKRLRAGNYDDNEEKRDAMAAVARASTSLDEAAYCVAEDEGCDAGFELYWKNYAIKLKSMKEKDVKRVAAGAWKTTIETYKRVKCE